MIELKELLDLAPEARQQQDLEAMCSGLRANHNTFFVDLPDEVLLELCKTIYAAEYEPGVKVRSLLAPVGLLPQPHTKTPSQITIKSSIGLVFAVAFVAADVFSDAGQCLLFQL